MRTSLILGIALLSMMVFSGGSLGADLMTVDKGFSLNVPVETLEKRLTPIGTVVQAEEKKEKARYLVGNVDEARAIVITNAGEQQTFFRGKIGFMVLPDEREGSKLILTSLNLVSNGVPVNAESRSEKKVIGDSGVIGLNLVEPNYETAYDSRNGDLRAEFESTLHYSLIDEELGFIPAKSEEGDLFLSQTEMMAGSLEAKLPEKLEPSEKGLVAMDGVLYMELKRPVLGYLEGMTIYIDISKLYWSLTQPADIIKVQPVFIGTGPSDPAATGWAYNPMLTRVGDIWNRCGSVRCICFISNQPMYVNNNAYKVLNSEAEAASLRAEVNVVDAVEIFVVDQWDPYFDGGGACWSSGTASAKVVTCDQQLAVPCPMPAGLWGCSASAGGSCGDVNYYHLAHELGHAVNLLHPGDYRSGMVSGSSGSIMEPSGFCRDNPNVQSARNCCSASSPLFYSGRSICAGSPDIND